MKFEVKQSHIDAANQWVLGLNAKPYSPASTASARRSCNCPTSLALLAHLGRVVGEVTTVNSKVWVHTGTYAGAYDTTSGLKSQISRWDEIGEFVPGAYEIILDVNPYA